MAAGAEVELAKWNLGQNGVDPLATEESLLDLWSQRSDEPDNNMAVDRSKGGD